MPAPRSACGRCRRPRTRERMRDLALAAVLAELAIGKFADHAAPEADRIGVARLFGDGPLAGIAREQQDRCAAPDALAAKRTADEELAQSIVAPLLVRRGERALHDRESGRLVLAQDHERGLAVVVEPALDDFGDALPGDGERRKHAGRVRGQVGEVLAVDLLDPVAIGPGVLRFTDRDRHRGSPERERPGEDRGVCRAFHPAVQGQWAVIAYCAGAGSSVVGSVGAAGSIAGSVAAGSVAAGSIGAGATSAAGGVSSTGAVSSCLAPQAPNTRATAMAPQIFAFIVSYPSRF